MAKKIEQRLRDLEIRISPKEDKKPLQIIVVHDNEIPRPKDDGSEVLVIRIIKTITSNPATASPVGDAVKTLRTFEI